MKIIIEKCEKCGKKIKVERMIIQKYSFKFLPECGHMHDSRVTNNYGEGARFITSYDHSDFAQNKNGDWELIGFDNKLLCPKCKLVVDGFDYCPRCGHHLKL